LTQKSHEELKENLDQILARHPSPEGELLAVLHDIQHTIGYIPPEMIEPLAQRLGMKPATLYGVITFYSDFKTTPPAETTIHICQGPACQLRGAEGILRGIQGHLGIKPGEKTEDGKIGLEIAQCPGICQQAPQLYVDEYVDEELQPKMSASEVVALLKRLQEDSDHVEK
jgi:NADH:ubiquinone oxidoreductase subunit E